MTQLPSRVLGFAWRSMLVGILVLCAGWLSWSFVIVATESYLPLPRTFGNFRRNVATLDGQEAPEGFSFAVAGDTRSFGTVESMMDVLKEEPLSFLVLLGDCTMHARPGDHRFFRAEVATEMATPYPTFYVVGNHDVSPDNFDLESFERSYGPSQFRFFHGGHLFVLIRVLGADADSMDDTLAFLEGVLHAEREKAEKVFVFQHIPPPISSDISVRRIAQPDRLLELYDRYGVDYVFAGDWHGYFRVKRKNTVYLITGGGGAHLEGSKYGAFHHALVLKVGADGVSEHILPVAYRLDLEDKLEYLALVHLWPVAERWPAFPAIVMAALIVSTIGMLMRLIGYCRMGRSQRRQKGGGAVSRHDA